MMPPALRLAILVWLALLLSAPHCGRQRGFFKTVLPERGQTITSFRFDVVVELGPAARPGTLAGTLNGEPLAFSGGPTRFAAHVDPGPPLRDTNLLKLSVVNRGGVRKIRRSAFHYLPPKARARRITRPSELITGPLAHGRIGDWLLENSAARFVVQDSPQRDLYSIGEFGGNLIDAELVVDGVRQGNDNFLEMQPAVNVESVINARAVEVLNDGEDGTTAVLRACGPDDLFAFVNASSQVAQLGVTLPPGTDDTDLPIEGCTEYRLDPFERHVTVETRLTNLGTTPLDLFSGDYLNGAGEVEQWTSRANTLSPQGIGELQANPFLKVFSYFGFGQATGLDYGLVPLPVEGGSFPFSSSFTDSGVSFVMAGTSIPLVLIGVDAPSFPDLQAGETRSFTRLFQIGDGSPANLVALQLEREGVATGRLEGVVTVGGVPAPGARVVAGPTGIDAAGDTVITDLTSVWVTDASGLYSGPLPVGSFGVAASLEGVPYQGAGPKPAVNPVTIASGGTAFQDIALPATGRVRVEVVDHDGASVPARVSVVGFDPSPEPELRFFFATITGRAGLFRDVTKDPIPYGLTWVAYTDAAGVAEFDLEPGAYEIFVSRGTEYSLFRQPLTVTPGPFGVVTQTVEARIHEVVDSPGFVSSDYHVHMIASPDSRINVERRVLSFAGEGVDNIIATDHDALTQLAPTIAATGMSAFVHSTIGEEITTLDYGHFNAYPQAQDPAVPSQGSTDFGRPTPVGENFPSLGSYNLTPAEIEDEARNKRASDGSVQNAGLETVVHVNHIDSHFVPLRIDTSIEPPASQLDPLAFDGDGNPTPANPRFFRLDPAVANFFSAFDGLELWNGATTGAQQQFLGQRIGIWMNHLNQGIPITAIADTDTHTFFDLETAGARTWTPTSTGSDAPAAILDNDIGRSVKAGKAVGGQGLYLRARLVDPESGGEAGFGWEASTLVTATDGSVDLVIDVQAPTWAPYDTIELYANASTCVAQANGGVPVLFGAVPTQTLVKDGVDTPTTFTVATEPVNGASRLRTRKTLSLSLPQDTWVVVVAKGTQRAGGSPAMFPVYPRSLSSTENPPGNLAALLDSTPTESGVRALGFTNALFVDVDGNAHFDAPGCAGRCGVTACP